MRDFKILLLVVLDLTFSVFNFAQTKDESWKIYDDSQVARIDITIAPAALQFMYKNAASDSEHIARIHFKNKYIDETIDSVGFRLRGNTSRDAQKKSFKVSFNSFFSGRNFYGIEKLNLNGEHNDPSIIRSKLCFDHFSAIGLNASRASHAQVFINGEYYGLYISTEHIDEEFIKRRYNDDSGNLWKCLYPANLVYLGDNNPQLYKNLLNNGTPVYELSTNKAEGDFSQLAHLIKIINKTPAAVLADSLENIIAVEEVLKYLAMNILLGSWDSYWTLMNNYYLYQEPATGLFHIIPYDYDNTFGIEWGNANWSAVTPYNPPRVAGNSTPLADRIMGDAQYRNLYTHFLEFFKDNVFKLSLWQNHLDSLQQIITPFALADSYRTRDYGFSVADFTNSYSASLYSNKHVKFGLKQYVNLRNANLSSQLKYMDAKPLAYKIDYLPKHPKVDDSIYVFVAAFSKTGINKAEIKFQKSGMSEEVYYTLKFSPVLNSKKVEDADRYVGVIPPLGEITTGNFRINLTDAMGVSQIYPRNGSISLSAHPPTRNTIVINEFLADNTKSTADQSGEYDDWVELFNLSDSQVLLTGKYLTDNPSVLNKWKFSKDSLFIRPNECLIVWLDEQGAQPGLHANFKLSKSGEFLALVDADGNSVLDSLSFGKQTTDISYGRFPDGSENWKLLSPSPGKRNSTTGISPKVLPETYRFEVYPNPFNPGTTLQYKIPVSGMVAIKLFDLLGRELKIMINEEKSAGTHELHLDGSTLSSGIYFCRLQAGKFTKTIKMQLLK